MSRYDPYAPLDVDAGAGAYTAMVDEAAAAPVHVYDALVQEETKESAPASHYDSIDDLQQQQQQQDSGAYDALDAEPEDAEREPVQAPYDAERDPTASNPATKPAAATAISGKWNEQFQELVTRLKVAIFHRDEQAEVDAYASLADLARNFAQAATIYADVITAEKNQPVESIEIHASKTMAGLAGGAKFLLKNGILLKFSDDAHGLYGGDVENASKASSHDLLGCSSVFSAEVARVQALLRDGPVPDFVRESLHVPLCCTIQHRGFTVLAASVLPIAGRDTLVLGSDNGGKPVDTDPVARRLWEEVCASLHLAQHGVAGVSLPGPFDAEIHVGSDGRRYVVDFSRLFPPEALTPKSPRGAHLYRLLRPELVLAWPQPLSSDAFSAMGREKAQEMNANVRAATESIFEERIPAFVRFLLADENPYKPGRYPSFSLTHLLHNHGINTRHLMQVLCLLCMEEEEAAKACREAAAASAENDDDDEGEKKKRQEEQRKQSLSPREEAAQRRRERRAAKKKKKQLRVEGAPGWVCASCVTQNAGHSLQCVVCDRPKETNPKRSRSAYYNVIAWRNVVLVEMAARTIKTTVRREWREIKDFTVVPFEKVLLKAYNEWVLTPRVDPSSWKEATTAQKEYRQLERAWGRLVRAIAVKFPPRNNDEDDAIADVLSERILTNTLPRRQLFVRLNELLGTRWVPSVMKERLMEGGQAQGVFEAPFEAIDLIEAQPVVSSLNISAFAQARTLHLKAQNTAHSLDQARKLLVKAAENPGPFSQTFVVLTILPGPPDERSPSDLLAELLRQLQDPASALHSNEFFINAGPSEPLVEETEVGLCPDGSYNPACIGGGSTSTGDGGGGGLSGGAIAAIVICVLLAVVGGGVAAWIAYRRHVDRRFKQHQAEFHSMRRSSSARSPSVLSRPRLGDGDMELVMTSSSGDIALQGQGEGEGEFV